MYLSDKMYHAAFKTKVTPITQIPYRYKTFKDGNQNHKLTFDLVCLYTHLSTDPSDSSADLSIFRPLTLLNH